MVPYGDGCAASVRRNEERDLQAGQSREDAAVRGIGDAIMTNLHVRPFGVAALVGIGHKIALYLSALIVPSE